MSIVSNFNNNFNNLGLTVGKYLIKIIFLTLTSKSVYLKCRMFQISMILSIFDFGTNLGLAGAKHFIKIIFDIKK